MDLSETEALIFNRAVLRLGTFENDFFTTCVLDRDFPSSVVVPLNCVLNYFSSQLIL